LNGRGTLEENEFSKRLADITGLPMTGASDSHRPQDIGKCCTEIKRDVKSVFDLIDALKSGDVSPVSLKDC
jgi:histidinol phosphatase-like PHP family hydrolase